MFLYDVATYLHNVATYLHDVLMMLCTEGLDRFRGLPSYARFGQSDRTQKRHRITLYQELLEYYSRLTSTQYLKELRIVQRFLEGEE